MRQQAVNTFNEGLNFDLNPLTTPNNVLTDAVNASFITFNGDELALQNDAGNTKIIIEGAITTYKVVKYGYLYNWYSVNDSRNICNEGWRVCNINDYNNLLTYLGGTDGVSNDKLRETGTEYWALEGTATNELSFNARGSGERTAYSYGGFVGEKDISKIWIYGQPIAGAVAFFTIDYSSMWSQSNLIEDYGKKNGWSVRLVRNATTEELSLPNGATNIIYIGNDGTEYSCCKIGTLIWISSNLMETKYNNGDSILEITDNTAWSNLTTEARCSYNNDETNGYIDTMLTSTKEVQLSEGFYPLGIKEYGGVLYIVSGKLPDILAENVDEYIEGTFYISGTKVYVSTSKLFYEKKVTGIHSLPLEGSNTYWSLIGDVNDYNNKYGYIEIGSYPSPEASDKKLFSGVTTLYDNSNIATMYRWYPTGVVSCIIGEDLKNTGNQNVEEKYQSSPDGGTTWVDVVGTPTRTSVYTNITACPVPFNWAGISVDATAYSIPNEVEIPYAENTTLTVQTPIKAGFNYIFLSIPQSKSVIIRDSMNNNITNLFTIVGTDNRTTHTINNIYKKNDAFATNLSTVLYITIY